ncbi:MAG: YihY/virulence factor BrkB family protein, partial [Victivallales bacterium]|nr:YihY/virulence factor BrkB family protein [Victivallales bacterium]
GEGIQSAGKYTRLAAALPEPMQQAVIQLLTYVDNTNFAALGIVGLITLLFTVVMSIKKLEDNFNAIWCIRRGRSLPRQFSEYLVILLMLPVITTAALSLDTLVSPEKIAAVTHLPLAHVTFWLSLSIDLLLALFVIGAFVFLYIFMPNTKVHFFPALVAGLFSAIVWGGVLWVYIHWQVGLARFNAIYGTFAALPFFLGWLYTEWVVVLAGAELCYSLQNHPFLRGAKEYMPLDPGANYLLGVAAMEDICATFRAGKSPWNAAKYASSHPVAINELEFALNILKQNGLILQLAPNAESMERYDYVPARPPAELTNADVYAAFLGMESGRAAKIAAAIPGSTAEKLKKQHRQNMDFLRCLSFAQEEK